MMKTRLSRRISGGYFQRCYSGVEVYTHFDSFNIYIGQFSGCGPRLDQKGQEVIEAVKVEGLISTMKSFGLVSTAGASRTVAKIDKDISWFDITMRLTATWIARHLGDFTIHGFQWLRQQPRSLRKGLDGSLR